ncbi:carbon-nitrogen hydrolase family protein [Piscinibacter sp.]|jgi:predicted amidohydrolase|uniref:carbon-nitrogen hydrolase family protein n=1 Tax=Piscinibacter sp. TaxID=1903157 RepID=UPI002F412C81
MCKALLKIKVAACQVMTTEDIEFSKNRVISFLEIAAAQQVDLVLFPEATLSGYSNRAEFWATARPEAFEAAERDIAAACKRLKLAAVVGSAFQGPGGWINGLAVFEKDGRLIGRYGKTFLGGDSWCTNFAARIPLIKVAGANVCFLICRDVRYPELVRLPAAMGAEICLISSCESGLLAERKMNAYRAMAIARAFENGIYVVKANTPADPDNLRRQGSSHGKSCIVSPEGEVLREAGFFEECIISEEIRLGAAHGHTAKRTLIEKTVLNEWYREGLNHVERIAADDPGELH